MRNSLVSLSSYDKSWPWSLLLLFKSVEDVDISKNKKLHIVADLSIDVVVFLQVIQIFRSTHEGQLGDRTPDRHKIQPQLTQLRPFLLPEVHDKFCTVWYDWFA